MSHTFTLTDEQYARLERTAHDQGHSAEELFQAWLNALVLPANEPDIAEARARWAALNLQVQPPTDEELRAHPFLRVVGIA